MPKKGLRRVLKIWMGPNSQKELVSAQKNIDTVQPEYIKFGGPSSACKEIQKMLGNEWLLRFTSKYHLKNEFG